MVQKALEYVDTDLQVKLVSELSGGKNDNGSKNIVLSCVEDQNANHVIQKCLERMPVNEIEFIIEVNNRRNIVEK